MDFRIQRSLGKIFTRIEKMRATFRNCPATLETFRLFTLGIHSIGSLTEAWLTLKALQNVMV
jgi:arginyl-tRNA--protein-N-Asp/Glu arginylyltransferase